MSSDLATWLEALVKYLNERIPSPNDRYRPTRVALLDNGVQSIIPVAPQSPETTASAGVDEKGATSKGIWSRIVKGRSFVENSRTFNSWHLPCDPHGTQMANLICAVDPTCELYVARVAEDARGIQSNHVAKVCPQRSLIFVLLFAHVV